MSLESWVGVRLWNLPILGRPQRLLESLVGEPHFETCRAREVLFSFFCCPDGKGRAGGGEAGLRARVLQGR